jgi:leader peptidase (prepilin peptidase)/N-methyltransferase
MNEFVLLHPTLTFVFFSLFCLAIGSFLNVVIYRLPLMIKADYLSQCRHALNAAKELNTTVNLVTPRSFCPACNKMIPFWHNIPLVSYLILKGRCKNCRQAISLRYPFVESSCLILSLAAAAFFGFNFTLIFALLFIWLIICLSFIDIEHQMLPDSLTFSLLWLGLIANTMSLFTTLPNAVLSAAGAYLVLWLFIKLFYLLTGKIGMGHGDFKLFAALGAWFGGTALPFIILFSSLLGAVTGLIYLKTTHQTKETPIPFGPFLCFSGLLSLFYGETIIQWYLGVFS